MAAAIFLALFIAIYLPIVPFRAPCYDGDFRTVPGTIVNPYKRALLKYFRQLAVDHSVHYGALPALGPAKEPETVFGEIADWQQGTVRITVWDWLDDNDAGQASTWAILSLVFEDYGADLEAIPEHVKEILKAGVKGPYVMTDCALVRAVAVEWRDKP